MRQANPLNEEEVQNQNGTKKQIIQEEYIQIQIYMLNELPIYKLSPLPGFEAGSSRWQAPDIPMCQVTRYIGHIRYSDPGCKIVM